MLVPSPWRRKKSVRKKNDTEKKKNSQELTRLAIALDKVFDTVSFYFSNQPRKQTEKTVVEEDCLISHQTRW